MEENRKYTIIPSEDIDTIDFSQVIEAKATCRYKIDNSAFIVKFTGSTPSFLEGYTLYSVSEMLDITSVENGWEEEE